VFPKSSDVVVIIYDGVRLLDVTGPLEVFAEANGHGAAYRLRMASLGGADIRTGSGVRLGADIALEDVGADIHILLVPGSCDVDAIVRNEPLLDRIRTLAKGAERTASVCAGAFALAAAGLLDGRRAATHWDLADRLAALFPQVDVDNESIFVRDGKITTSAGVTSGIDLALALVEEDYGADLARTVAKHLVVFMHRPGGQSQFSVRLRAGGRRSSVLRQLMDEVNVDPAGDHSLALMAVRSGLSMRHLTRLFRRETGLTPARYVELVRIEAAQHLLERGDDLLDVVARRSGLGSTETMRRAFARELGVTPAAYRMRFRTTGIGKRS
jgi:transcriptional regulator GlxA family with amidase domain